MMTASDVIDLYARLEKLGIALWICGGWGVDSLLGAETRPHPDLDVFIQWKHNPRFRVLMEDHGYREIKLEIARPENYVLGDANGREIDVHVFDFDTVGNVVYRHADSAEVFPGESLAGVGSIAGRTVRCVAPEWQVRWHTGYVLREVDFQDVPALCERFRIEYPEEYAHLKEDTR
jgi:lincosamide nucleotidyltransferase A/C/D/E